MKSTRITDESVDTLLKFTKLEKLNVAATQLTDEGFKKLGAMKSLKWLNVANTNVGSDLLDDWYDNRKDLTGSETDTR